MGPRHMLAKQYHNSSKNIYFMSVYLLHIFKYKEKTLISITPLIILSKWFDWTVSVFKRKESSLTKSGPLMKQIHCPRNCQALRNKHTIEAIPPPHRHIAVLLSESILSIVPLKQSHRSSIVQQTNDWKAHTIGKEWH